MATNEGQIVVKSAKLEGLKEGLRWIVSVVGGFILVGLTDALAQGAIPNELTFTIGTYLYHFPLLLSLQLFVVPILIRVADKTIYINQKKADPITPVEIGVDPAALEYKKTTTSPTGLFHF